ncbi:MAG: hypothetical protein EAZ31_01415 [Cytophagia bacterium]|nr:MAG: hypothetical protein EAZ31_01415 [Cytophagia bacterium]
MIKLFISFLYYKLWKSLKYFAEGGINATTIHNVTSFYVKKWHFCDLKSPFSKISQVYSLYIFLDFLDLH